LLPFRKKDYQLVKILL